MSAVTIWLETWLQPIATSVAAIAAVFLLLQILLLKRQIQLSTKWNKLSITFTCFSIDRFVERERRADDALNSINIDILHRDTPLDNNEIKLIWENRKVFRQIKDYLNLIEEFAAAVLVGALDPDCAYAILNHRINTVATVYQPFIDYAREKLENNKIYIEFEKLSTKWKERHLKEIDADKLALERLKEQQRQRGVKEKV